MVSIKKNIQINAPIHHVYHYITHSEHWPVLFSPFTVNSPPYLQIPPNINDSAVKPHTQLLAQKGKPIWIPEISDPPHYILAYGKSPLLFGLRGYIRYDLCAENQQTYFTRTLFYTFDHDLMKIVFGHIIRLYFSYISTKNINKTKKILDIHL